MAPENAIKQQPEDARSPSQRLPINQADRYALLLAACEAGESGAFWVTDTVLDQSSISK